MSKNQNTVWKFETRNFAVYLDFEDDRLSPLDCMAPEIAAETVKDIEANGLMWFEAVVRVCLRGQSDVIGWATCGACAYWTIDDFRFGDGTFRVMVHEALSATRKVLKNHAAMAGQLRAV